MIDLQEVLYIHEILIQEFGGAQGVRDLDALLAAIERPFTGFSNTEFYPTPEEKASAIMESIITNHPFVDGNKRIGYTLMRLILLNFNKDIGATAKEKIEFTIQVASGQLSFEAILRWIKSKSFDM